jgi:histone H3/H4
MKKEVLIERVKERLRGDVVFERIKEAIGEEAVARIIKEEVEEFLGGGLRDRVRELIKGEEVEIYKEEIEEVLEDLFNFLSERWRKVVFRRERGEWLMSSEKEIYGVIDIKLKQIFITTKCFKDMYEGSYRHVIKILGGILRRGKKGFTTTKRIKLRDGIGEKNVIVSGYLIDMVRLKRLGEKVLEDIKKRMEEMGERIKLIEGN